MVTLEDVFNGAQGMKTGNKQASVKFALWSAACSASQQLTKNGEMSRALAPYVTRPLPDRDTLAVIFRQVKCFFTGRLLDSLYYIEALDNAGKLEGLDTIGVTYEQQVAWRDQVHSLVNGHGMGYKMISFAALILAPDTCELVPVDRHVLARLDIRNKAGKLFTSSPSKRSEYQAIEAMIIRERFEAGQESIPLATWHWYKWEQYRQETGASKATDSVESHAALSCYWY